MSRTDWPASLRGITETVVTTRHGPDRWNVAALGVHAPDATERDRATARTWGRTRTRRNFHREGNGYIQFVHDPVTFAEAALTRREDPEPILDESLAWVRVSVEELERGETGGTEWVDWTLSPVESRTVRESVPTINRGYNAVIEATIAASRLDVERYDRVSLEARLSRLEEIIERCGGPAERRALDVVRGTVTW